MKSYFITILELIVFVDCVNAAFAESIHVLVDKTDSATSIIALYMVFRSISASKRFNSMTGIGLAHTILRRTISLNHKTLYNNNLNNAL